MDDDQARTAPPVVETPAAGTAASSHTLADRGWGRWCFGLALTCLITFGVLAARRGDGCVGRAGTEPYESCRADDAVLEFAGTVTGGAALVLFGLGIVLTSAGTTS